MSESPSHQRHLQWLSYYHEVVDRYKTKEPKIFHRISRVVFYEEVAERFGVSAGTVQNTLCKLMKNRKGKN